ncbi:MAG: tetraacyldisaccharide 4'-kinase [Candidatus Nitrotoga sp.]|jgi:tetraacyldisaccharide 4'-kinase|nr:tetraacyldisaccharide 4'-kinase [Candidatus Nitrotoga sp.]MBP0118167.1 tetraacyldisaccharide 4'-kinase [Candidatus Nitrotoga sp.]MDW7604249.1 tetraacyldisaccharide 4'-kinase [Candidatus Nitrotoga sp.]MDW7612500.1 tetraacyldisaccharide 4'-kinase [Candidatus Nitrotoga sp.]
MRWLPKYWNHITALHSLLLPVSFIFYMLVVIRRALYRSGILVVTRLPVPVIVVGNITVGGSGKTPLTLWLAQQLIDRGWHPGIVSHGYGGSGISPMMVCDSSNPSEVGDEPVLMAQRKLCPVWVGRDRVGAAQALLLRHPECDILLSDDGLQHYHLHRDFEIAVVDGVSRFGNKLMLPAGPLREPLSRLAQVDAVVINGGMVAMNQYGMQLQGESFYNLLNPGKSAKAMNFYGQRLYAIAGIGHPQRFFTHLNGLGLDTRIQAFPDHHNFTSTDLDYPDADAIFMTEKDAVKCTSFANERFWVLRVDAQLNDSLLINKILERPSFDGH